MKSAIVVAVISVCLLIVSMVTLSLGDDIGLKHVAIVVLFSAEMTVLAIVNIDR